MNIEIALHHIETAEENCEEQSDYFLLEDSEDFDFTAFFEFSENQTTGDQTLVSNSNAPLYFDLLSELSNQAESSIATFTTRMSAENFSTGAYLASNVFSTLSSIIGACGPLCLHAAGALAQSGASLGGVSSLGGVALPGFNIDGSGKYTLSGDINALSSATGLSSQDLMSGKYSSNEIVQRYFESLGFVFGFGLVGGFINLLFDAFTPQVRG